jgi:Helix-turn-helix domain
VLSLTTCRGDVVKQPHQLALFHADTRFVLLVTSLFSSGLAAKLGPSAVVVFLVLRSSANYQTGKVFLGQRLIAEQAGITTATARRALATLEAHGLITRHQPHANARTTYTITDRIPVFQRDDEGEKQPAGTLTIPYVPVVAAARLNEARAALVRGVVPQGSPVTLHLTINVVQHTGTGDVVINSGPQERTFQRGAMDDETVAFFLRKIAEAGDEVGNEDKKPQK